MVEFSSRVDFHRSAIQYLEARVALVDNKAAALMAAVAVWVGVLGYFYDRVAPTAGWNWRSVVGAGGLVVTGGLFVSVVYLLLKTIRPTEGLFGHKGMRREELDIGDTTYLMWAGRNWKRDPQAFKVAASQITEAEIVDNYQATHFAALQFVHDKYRPYRQAVLMTKYLLVWTVVFLALLGIIQMSTW